jgi:hypothetical protein
MEPYYEIIDAFRNLVVNLSTRKFNFFQWNSALC